LAVALTLSLVGARRAVASSPDFSLTVTPDNATVSAGSSTRFHIVVTSENGFAGSIHVGITSISPSETNGPLFHLARYDVPVSPTSPTATALVTASTSTTTPATTYTMNVSGKDISGGTDYGLTHTTSFTLGVAP
jgi:hypothetical protein